MRLTVRQIYDRSEGKPWAVPAEVFETDGPAGFRCPGVGPITDTLAVYAMSAYMQEYLLKMGYVKFDWTDHIDGNTQMSAWSLNGTVGSDWNCRRVEALLEVCEKVEAKHGKEPK